MPTVTLTADTLDTVEPAPELLELALELAGIARPAWSAVSDGIPAWHPRLEGDDDDDDAGDSADDDDDEADAGDTAGDDEDDDDGADELTRARKALAKTNRRLRELERQRKRDAAKALADAGRWKELAEERERELEELRREQEEGHKRNLALAALTAAGARKPDKALRHLDLDAIEDADDATRAVRELKREEDYLFGKTATRQARNGGKRDEDRSTRDDEDAGKPRAVGVDRIRRHYASTSSSGSGSERGAG